MQFIKPKALKPWDTIWVISPSWWVPSIFPSVYEDWLNTLKKIGFKIKELETARALMWALKGNPLLRAKDINNAFLDKEIDGIITTIWWWDAVETLPYLNIDGIRNNPKMILWFSDTSVITAYLNQMWLVTFNWPSIMAGFSQFEFFPEDYQEYLKSFLFNIDITKNVPAFNKYCDWYVESNRRIIQELKNDLIWWQLLQWEWTITWELFGWCLEALEYIRWTEFWPGREFRCGKILFLEKALSETNSEKLENILREYGKCWIFDRISAMIFWRAKDCSDIEKKALNESIKNVVQGEFSKKDLPIVTNMSFGHTDPQFILPLWINAELNCGSLSFKLLESPFQ